MIGNDGKAEQVAVKPRMLGEELVWLFVIGDMCIFAMFFWVYVDMRADKLILFRSGQAMLDINYGSANTLLLLTSSWLVVKAQYHVRTNNAAVAFRLLLGASLLGASFVGLKINEYIRDAAAGLSFQTNDFFIFYYTLTGLHLAHVITGVAILIYFAFICREGKISVQNTTDFGSGAIFWHMVDLLWIIILTLIYLLR